MQIALFKMPHVIDLIIAQDELGSFEFRNCFLWPEAWHSIIDLNDLNWINVEFNPDNVIHIPESPGIYSFSINPRITNHPLRYLGYIGKTDRTLRERYNEYLKEHENPFGRPKILRMLNKWRGYIDFSYVVMKDVDPAEIESRLNDAFLPPFNDQFSTDVNRIINAF